MHLSAPISCPETGRSRRGASSVVEVSLMALDVTPEELARFTVLLAPDERRRAAAFRFSRDRQRFIVRRGRLRELLAARLGCAPQEVPLSYGPFGKPRIADSTLRFNLSHCDGVALFVLAQGIELGCDIEWRRPQFASRRVAKRFFSACENAALDQLSGDQWVEAFFNCWTRKEAVVKALGLGLSYPLSAFDVSVAPDEPATLLRGPAGWSLQAFAPMPDLHAAVTANDPIALDFNNFDR